MKTTKALIPSLFAALILSAATIAHADNDMPNKHEARMQEHLQDMKKDLNLTDEQEAKIKALHESRMEKRKAEHQAMQKEMDAILTPEQQEKAKKIRAERKEKYRGHHGNHASE